MTYNVFGGTLSLTQSIYWHWYVAALKLCLHGLTYHRASVYADKFFWPGQKFFLYRDADG